jgi:hypothetical protein
MNAAAPCRRANQPDLWSICPHCFTRQREKKQWARAAPPQTGRAWNETFWKCHKGAPLLAASSIRLNFARTIEKDRCDTAGGCFKPWIALRHGVVPAYRLCRETAFVLIVCVHEVLNV